MIYVSEQSERTDKFKSEWELIAFKALQPNG